VGSDEEERGNPQHSHIQSGGEKMDPSKGPRLNRGQWATGVDKKVVCWTGGDKIWEGVDNSPAGVG